MPSATSSCAGGSNSRRAPSPYDTIDALAKKYLDRTGIRGPGPVTCASTCGSTSSASSGVMQRRCLRIGAAGRPAALHLRADARHVAARRGRGRRLALHLGSLLPALRRSRRCALRVLEPARGDGGGDGAHPLRRARHLQLLPQPEPARRHGAHRRPHLRRPADPRPRLRLVRARLHTSTATSSARRSRACRRSATPCR